MRGRKPREPDGKKIFADTERPIGKRFGHRVGGCARACFRAVRSERDPAGKKRGGPSPFRAETRGDTERENGSRGRADERVQKIPDCVEIRNLVGEKFEDVKSDGETENDGVRKYLKLFGKMNDVESFEKAECGDGGVEIEAGRKTGPEGETDGLERTHRR